MNKTPDELSEFLDKLLTNKIKTSLMIWGAPGIGKSSIVSGAAARQDINVVDLRLSQLAPTDLRGLPAVKDEQAVWYAPEFLPTTGAGILFLDEINMAPPAMQGVAQQLILDRRVGSYKVPDDWYVWAAGNRKEDKAAVFQMPSALSNRFLHVSVQADLDSFKQWGLRTGITEQILAFLAFRPALLHKIHASQPAWPSPRSWVMANELFKAGLSIAPAVGVVSAEFEAFLEVYDSLPELDDILTGKISPEFPKEPSKRYALTIGMVVRSVRAEQAFYGLKWIAEKGNAEWLQFFITSLLPQARERNYLSPLIKLANADPALREVITKIRDMILSV